MLVLASTSPRRIQMFTDLRVDFQTVSPGVEEKRGRGESPRAYVLRLSKEKAESVRVKLSLGAGIDDWFILAADTTVVLGKELLEKPRDAAHAVRMLKKLSGKRHTVLTGFSWQGCVGGRVRRVSQVVATDVAFAKRPDAFWRWYVSTGEPMDKAGAYAAQGIGLSFVREYKGSYSNVVGLPFSEVLDAFAKAFGPAALKRAFPCF